MGVPWPGGPSNKEGVMKKQTKPQEILSKVETLRATAHALAKEAMAIDQNDAAQVLLRTASSLASLIRRSASSAP